MDYLEMAKKGYEDFNKGNIEAVLPLFDPQIEWNASNGFPYVTGDGIYTGPNAVAQEIFAQMPKHFDNFHIDIQELFACGEKVVMVGYYTGAWKATGKKFKANATHVWTVKDGTLTHFFQAVDTATIVNP
jgi:ketosteroid isomerase-like protein